jgi:hypothetical protein
MKTIRALFWICVLGGGIYVGWQVFPAYINNYRLQESIDDSARSAAVKQQLTEEDIRRTLYNEAQELEIPLKPEDIKIERVGGDVVISADYTVRIDVPMRPFDLQFHPGSRRGALTFR